MSTGATLAEAVTSGRGVERPFRCHVHDDSNASASVNVLKGVWVCYACGAHGTVDGVDLVPDAEEIIQQLLGTTVPRVFAESWLDMFDAYETSPYWSERYGDAIANEYRCGTHPVTGAPTYPIRDVGGRPIGVVQRGDIPKYKYPYGVSTSRTLFGHIRPNPVVILVEGAADVMALAQAGIPSNWTVLGCYGAGLHVPQAQILSDLAPVIVVTAFDDDDAGRSAMSRSEAMLNNVTPCVSYLWGTVGGKDPGEVAVQQRIAGLKEALNTTAYRRFAA